MKEHSFTITADNLSFGYEKETLVLENISFEIETGKVVGLLGHNGSGKSTLLKLIGGLLKPLGGNLNIYPDNANYKNEGIYHQLGLLIEEPGLYRHLSVFDNMKIAALYRGIPFQRIDDYLKKVKMEDYAHYKVRQLSTGMRQRVGIAMVLLGEPEILILDEPTNGLDPDGIVEIRNLLSSISSEGKTIVVSSHLLSEVEKTCDHLLILRSGRLVFKGDITQISQYRDLESFYLDLRK